MTICTDGVPFVVGAATGFALNRFAFFALICVLATCAILFEFALLQAAFGGGSESQESKTNCPSCGARTTTEPDACDYCEEALIEDR